MAGHPAECTQPDYKFMPNTNYALYNIKKDCLEAGLRHTAFHANGRDK